MGIYWSLANTAHKGPVIQSFFPDQGFEQIVYLLVMGLNGPHDTTD